MKKNICIMLVLVMIFSMFAGCDSGEKTSSGKDKAVASSNFPNKPIEMIVPFSAGGSTDIAARVIAKNASKYLPNNQTVVVINKPGASATLGVTDLLKAEPDGYTIMLGASTGFSQGPYMIPNLEYDHTDVSYLMKVANLPVFMQVPPDSEFKTLEDMIEYMKDKNNDPLTIGTIGVGTAGHLAMEILAMDYDISNYINIPFKSTSEAWNGLQQKSVDAIFCATDSEVDFLRLATSSSVRSDMYPDVPTFTEKGYKMNIGTCNILITDKDVPEEIRTILTDAFSKALNDPDTVETFEKVGIEHDYKNGAEAEALVLEEFSWSVDLLKALNLYVNDPKKK